MWSVSPSGVHCHSQSDHFARLPKVSLVQVTGTVSYMRSNITQFQDHFLFKIPVLFCNQLSGFANTQNQTYSHRQNQSHVLNQAFRVRQILLQQTNCWHTMITMTGNLSHRNHPCTSPGHRREGSSWFLGQLNSGEMQNEGPFRDSRPLLNSFFHIFFKF